MSKRKAHPGFEAVAEKIARTEHVPIHNADAILAASSRRASTSAKEANPALKKVVHRKFSPDMMGGSTKRRRRCKTCGRLPLKGKGWEDELAKAMERDKQNQADQSSASAIKAAAMADTRKRGGTTRRKAIC